MKNIKLKFISAMLIAVLCFSSSSLAVFAEDGVTTGITTLSSSITHTEYSLTGKYVSFSWNKVEDTSGKAIRYAIRMWRNDATYSTDNKVFLKKGLKNNYYNSSSGLLSTESYRYQVAAYYADESPAWDTATISTISIPSTNQLPLPTSFTVKLAYPSKAENTDKLGEIKQKDNTVAVEWTVADASVYSHFDIYRINSSGKRTKAGSVNASANTTYKFKDYSPKGTFDYVLYLFPSQDPLRCVSTVTAPVQGPSITCDYLTTSKVTTNHSWSAKAKKKITLYKSPGGSAYTTVPKGTMLDATGGYAPEKFAFWEEPTWVEVEYNDRTCWVKWSQVKMKWHLTYKDYAWSVKEDFVNDRDFDSNTDYLIWVSRYTHRTNVFHKEGGKWHLIKVYDCNTGNYYQPLKGGQYYIKGHEAIKYKIHETGREYYFEYSTKFGGSGTFHTRCRWVDTGNLRNAIKRHPTTKGCCRLYDDAAKYIYGLPNGTGVIVK